MAEFTSTSTVMLRGSFGSDGSFQWSTKLNLPTTGGTVSDPAGSGANVLSTDDQYSSTAMPTSGVFSGHYIEVDLPGGGTGLFGVFSTPGFFNFFIPYDNLDGTFDLNAQLPTSGATSLYDETLENAANCFLAGTRITTPEGDRAIETLTPGDTILTADGRAVPVLWVWQQEIANIFGLSEARAPIRVTANALGPGCPARDLTLTADHALALDGLLINAGALVNGTTIHAIPLAQMPARFTYWHVETEAHEVVLAENCPAESFIDYTPRDCFDNHAAYLARYGRDRLISEMALPRVSAARLLPPRLRARLGIAQVA